MKEYEQFLLKILTGCIGITNTKNWKFAEKLTIELYCVCVRLFIC